MNQEKYLEYSPDSLRTEKLAFKILIMVSLLADNKLAYRGTLNDISRELGYAGTADTRRNKRIKEAIAQLEEANLVKVIRDGNIYTVSLSRGANERVIRIAKEIVRRIREALMNERTGQDWSYTLKVLLYLYETDNDFIEGANDRYYKEIALALGITTKQVGTAIKQLEERFQEIKTKRHYQVEEIGEQKLFKRLPTTISIKKEDAEEI